MTAHSYLEEARQIQALSLTVHIPLVCFGIAFPSMVLFAESRYLRTGDQLYRTIARRWSKVMLTLFAVGVVTGTILSFELGILWPNFVATFGNVFGLGFALEGFSFFLEAIFIGIYVYGWDRMSPRVHRLSGIPVVIAGITGSTFVIAVNAWMNHPGGFRLRHGKRRRRAPVGRAVWQLVPVAGDPPHVLRGVHGHGLPRRRVVRVVLPPRSLRSLRARGAGDPTRGGGAHLPDPDPRRRLGGA